MGERFIERGTSFGLRNGTLTLYETNCTCKGIQFHFDQYVMTLMLAGHKTIMSDLLKFEFFPGTFFIPEKGVINHISIPNASFTNPTRCLVLELNPSFIQAVYEEVLHSEPDKDCLFISPNEVPKSYFLSNDELLVQAFVKLFDLQARDQSPFKELIEELIIKEMLYRVFSTGGIHLLKMNFEQSIFDSSIRAVITHIKQHINQKLTTAELAGVAGLGQTTFFKVFKKTTGRTPVDYILHERIRQAKVLIQKGNHSLQEIAYLSGFNSYEYFCISFKKIEKMKPSHYKKAQAPSTVSIGSYP